MRAQHGHSYLRPLLHPLFRPQVVGWDEHEDSVYGLAWSAADPWLLASLSLDGRVALNKVPKNIKYKILI